MPGTAHGVADHESLGERTVVMRAVSADREKLRAATDQQYLLVADMAEKLSSVGDLVLRNPSVRSGPLGLGWSAISIILSWRRSPSRNGDAGSRPSPAPSSLPYASAGNV